MNTKVINIFGQNITTHIDNSVRIVQNRIEIIDVLSDFGYTAKAVDNSASHDEIIQSFFKVERNHLDPITLTCDKGSVAIVRMDENDNNSIIGECLIDSNKITIRSIRGFIRDIKRLLKNN